MSVQRRAVVLVASIGVVISGCAAKRPFDPIPANLYPSGTVYTYQPLNPTTIFVRDAEPCELGEGETAVDITSPEFKHALLRDLDTETVRISLSQLDTNGAAATPVVAASVKGKSYVLVIDYIKYFSDNRQISVAYPTVDAAGHTNTQTLKGNVPIYAGVGVRVRAEFVALESGLNISGLPGLSAAASQNRINGRLTVQTLGLTGPDVTELMPIISDISVTSIQNAVQAIAAIKARLYEDSTVAYPKIVGFESPSTNPIVIEKFTEVVYGLNEYVAPRVSPNPMKPGERLLWIKWFAPPPPPAACGEKLPQAAKLH